MKNSTKTLKTFAERFRAKISLDTATGCYNWTGGRASQGRYPIVGVTGQAPRYAHNIAWEIANGRPVPRTKPSDGSRRWEVHHRCQNRACVNPDHLLLLTSKQHTKAHQKLREAQKAEAALAKMTALDDQAA